MLHPVETMKRDLERRSMLRVDDKTLARASRWSLKHGTIDRSYIEIYSHRHSGVLNAKSPKSTTFLRAQEESGYSPRIGRYQTYD
jgi:hypothetical protein